MRVAFDRCELDEASYELRRDGALVAVEPQVFDVLLHLLRHRDRVVTKEELLDTVWGDRFVSESALTSRIKAARRAVGDDGTAQRVIRTVHGRGYRFVADVQPLAETASVDTAVDTTVHTTSAAMPSAAEVGTRERQEVRFCTTADGARLAYGTVGDGPPLVKVANWLSHLEYDWESPVWQHWWRDLAVGRRLIRYDERGCGLSDWDVERFSLDTWVDDLEAVVDAVGVERFPLLGISQGGPVAIAYAVRHPERVTALVLYGTHLQGRFAGARSEQAMDEARLQIQLVRLGWGRDDPTFRRVFSMQFMPEATPELWAAFDELQRRTTSTVNAVRFMEAFADVDVTDLAPQVRAPTLVLHARREPRRPVEEGRRVAASIPGSRFVTLDSPNHLLLADEPAWPVFLHEVRTFLAEVEAERGP